MLLERDVPLRVLHDLLTCASAGRGRIAFVSGDAGIGKSALTKALCEGSTVERAVIGRCDALATPRVLGPFVDICADLGIEFDGGRDALLGSLVRALRSRAATVIVVEDAHWADDASLELLSLLGRRAPDLAVLLVVTYRDDVPAHHPLRRVVGDLVTAESTTWLGLAPLSPAAVAELAMSSGASEPVVTGLHARTGGNPFFVTELLAADAEELPASVRMAVLARAERLSPDARATLDAVAVVPGRVERWLLDAMLDSGPEGLQACLDAGMLLAEANNVGFRHELARAAVLADMTDRQRHALNAAAMHALATRHGVDAARVAHHSLAADDQPMAAQWSRVACLAAGKRTAHHEAIRHGELALQHMEHLSLEEIAETRVEVARSMSAAARADEAEVVARQAVAAWRQLGDNRREAEALVVLSTALTARGRMAEAMEPIAQAIEILEREEPGRELAAAYTRMLSAHMLARERDAAVAWGRRAIRLATELGDPLLIGRAMVETGTADVVDGRFEGVQTVRDGIDLGRRHNLPGLVAGGLTQLGSATGEWRRHDLAVPALEEGIAIARDHNIEAARCYQVAWLARCRFDLGEWEHVEALARDANSPTSPIAQFVSLNTLGWLRARRGEADVWPPLDEALAFARRTGHLQRLWPSAVARAEAGWLEGAMDPHLELLAEVLTLAERSGHSLAAGEVSVWLQRAGALDHRAADIAPLYVDWLDGRHAEAVSALRSLGCPYEAAMAQFEAGDTTFLAEALATFERLHAAPMARAAEARLIERNVRLPMTRRSVTQSATPLHALSAREAEVLRLVAAGFTNPQIGAALYISRKTAEHHVSNILTKLAVSSRAEAAAAAARIGVLTG